MTKSDDRRALLVDRMADHVVANGLAAASLRPLARAAGTNDRMLLYYFVDRDALITAVLSHVADRITQMLVDAGAPVPLPLPALISRLATLVTGDLLWPYMRLWLDIAARAAHGEPLYCRIGEQLGRGFLAWGASQLASDNPDRDAARLLTQVEGMVLLKSIGMADVAMRGAHSS